MMKQMKSFCFVLLAGSCTGVFFYTRSFPVIRLYSETGADSRVIWAFSSWSRLAVYVVIATLILLAIRFLFSLIYAKIAGKVFRDVLQVDAYTYLPLCILAVSLLQFNTFLTYHFEGLLLLPQSAGYLLLLMAVIGVYHLKRTLLPIANVGRVFHSTFHADAKHPPTWKSKLLIVLISFLIYALVGFRITDHLKTGGDEPHYLLIAHSLLHDHDIAVSNNYKQQDYQAFYGGTLDPHLSIGKDGIRYSGHPIGLPLLLTPAYGLKGRQGAVLFMNVVAALLALQLYLLAFSATQSKRLSLIVWVVTSFTSPLLIYSSQIYPEIPSALLLATVYHSITSRKRKLLPSLLLGTAFALLPWMQQRMILPAIILMGYHITASAGVLRKRPWKKQQVLFTAIPVIFFVISGMGMAGFYALLYGNPLPNAPYASVGMTNVFSLNILLKQGLLGLLLDQESGLLIYSPYYLFMFAGFLWLIRYHFVRALGLFLLIASIYIPCGGFILQWRGAWSPVSRYMVVLIPFFLIPLCLNLKQITRNMYRYIFFFLVVLSFSWSFLFMQNPLLSIMRLRGINNLFEQHSNLVNLTRYFPSFNEPTIGNYGITGMWLVIIVAFSLWVYRSTGSKRYGYASGGTSGWSLPLANQLIVRNVKNVFRMYGIIFGCFLIVTTIGTHIGTHTDRYLIPQVAKNRRLREFFDNFDYDGIAKNQLLRQQPLLAEELWFEYISREKRGGVNTGGSRFIVSGPREFFPKGKYTAYFKMMVADNSVDDVVATIDVVAGYGKHLFNGKPLRAVDFSSSGQYELIPLVFELPEDVPDLETRVYFHNRVDINVKKIYIEPDLAEFYYNAGLPAFWKGEYEKAKLIWLRAMAASPHMRALYQLAIIEQLLEHWGHSLEILEQVVVHDPEFADAHYRLGVAFKETGDFEKAQQHFQQAVALLPSHLDAWQASLAISRQLGMEEQAKNMEHTINTLYHPQYPYAVNIGNQIMFMGYTLQNPAPGRLALEYYWKALSPMKEDYSFFVHFKHYGIKFQQDHVPQRIDPLTGQRKIYPTSQWQVGELVHERFEIDAPTGTFDLHLGVWDTQKRVPIISRSPTFFFRQNEMKLGEVTVN